MTVDRRTFVQQLLASGSLAVLPVRGNATRPKFDADPFSLGVASGDPNAQSVILWTRLAPKPFARDGGMDGRAVEVRWWVATDEQFRRVVRHGIALAMPDLAHSVHIDVQGLEPDTEYWYRFAADDAASPIGRTWTLHSTGASPSSVRFVTCSCQHYEQGFYAAYRHIVEDEPDFVVHLGDYIYDVSFGAGVRKHPSEMQPVTLADFRLFHALYKSDRQLQEAHRRIPFFTVPDNHDALNDFDRNRLAIRAAAYQAWYEHMPIRAWHRPGSATLSLYQSIDVGQLLRVNLLDTRQFRDSEHISEEDPNYGFGIYRPHVAERNAPSRTMLGAEQTRWLRGRLIDSPTHWNAIASTVPFGQFTFHRSGDSVPNYYYSSWDGYPANRREVVEELERTKNPIVLSGDVHSFWAKNVSGDGDQNGRTIAPEFVTTSISSGWPDPLSQPVLDNLSENLSVKYYEGRYRGYCLHDITATQWRTRMRGLDSVLTADSDIQDVATFEVKSGKSRVDTA